MKRFNGESAARGGHESGIRWDGGLDLRFLMVKIKMKRRPLSVSRCQALRLGRLGNAKLEEKAEGLEFVFTATRFIRNIRPALSCTAGVSKILVCRMQCGRGRHVIAGTPDTGPGYHLDRRI